MSEPTKRRDVRAILADIKIASTVYSGRTLRDKVFDLAHEVEQALSATTAATADVDDAWHYPPADGWTDTTLPTFDLASPGRILLVRIDDGRTIVHEQVPFRIADVARPLLLAWRYVDPPVSPAPAVEDVCDCPILSDKSLHGNHHLEDCPMWRSYKALKA